MKIEVVKNIAGANDSIAAQTRQALDREKVLAVNIMSSPGSGKTSFIMETIRRLKDTCHLAVIEGDIASSIDADTISKTGIPVVQINTGGNCSLEAHMIRPALAKLPVKKIDILLIENVGNLICPAENKLGEHKKVVIASLPEGHDKPVKYPVIFSEADAVIINKIDLAPYLDFDLEFFRKTVLDLNPKVKIFELSSKTGKGFPAWIKWLTGLKKK
jgi:hydrogenase nickel incorporation protein HypB